MRHTCSNHPISACRKDGLLVLTSSFPSSPHDNTTRFIYEHSCIFSKNSMPVTVLCPDLDRPYPGQDWKNMSVLRFRYFFPKGLQKLAYGNGILENIRYEPWLVFLVPFFMAAFLYNAILLAKNSKIVCSHWILPSGLIGAMIKKFFGKKHILIIHSAGVHLLKRLPFRRQIAKFIFYNCDHIIAVSGYIKNMFISILPAPERELAEDNIYVLPMGINGDYYKRAPGAISTKDPAEKVAILFIGRLVQIKGLEWLIKAVSGIKNITLVIAGDGHLKEGLEDMASALQVEARFLGRVSEPEKLKLLQEADCLVLPSITLDSWRTESMPVTIIEALSMGIPIIASNVGGIPEVIKDGYNGILVPEKDPLALRKAIEKIIFSRDFRVRLQINALETSINYTWKKIGTEYEKILAAI
jgi:glycosyltransferase involved in cell wall biosynthesis